MFHVCAKTRYGDGWVIWSTCRTSRGAKRMRSIYAKQHPNVIFAVQYF